MYRRDFVGLQRASGLSSEDQIETQWKHKREW